MTVAEVVASFAGAWNCDDDDGRARLLAACCVPDAVFVSPQGTIAGTGALAASIAEFRRAFPAAVVGFGAPDEHGGFVRVAWVTRWNTGRPELAGEDFAQLAADGRIRLLVSFDGAPQTCP
jgi:non-heme chloroperoxidase